MKPIRLLILFLIVSMVFGCTRPPGGIGVTPIIGGNYNLTVKVIDAFTGQAIPNARINLQKDGQGVSNDVPSDGSGLAVFQGIPGGIGYKAFANNVQGYTPGASPSLKLNQDMEVSIALQQNINGAGLVAGSVKDKKTQSPLAGVTVSLLPSSGDIGVPVGGFPTIQRQSRPVRRPPTPYYPPYRTQQISAPGNNLVQSDEAGQFTFNDVPAGTYEVTFSFANLQEEKRSNIVVNPGNSTTVETVFMGEPGSSVGAQGHLLIAESARVYQVGANGQTLWNFGGRQISSADRMEGGNTIISDEGNNDVSIVSPLGQVVWNMGSALGLFKRLSLPGWVSSARDGESFLVTDTGNNRIVEMQGSQTNWTQSFEFTLGLNRPRSATYESKSGNIIIADTGNKRVIEVTREGGVAWGAFKDMGAPVHAVRLDDGNTLITDAQFNRVIMLNQAGQSVWFYDGVNGGAQDPAGGLNRPRSAFKDPTTGNIFIVDTGNNRIVEVSINRQIVNVISPVNAPVSLKRL